MTPVIDRQMPHGAIPLHSIKDVSVRDVVMKMNENMLLLERQNRMLVKAVAELQRK